MNLPHWYDTISALGLGTIAAALIAGLVAFVVAKVNAKAARDLALDAAHRSYRIEITAPLLTYSRATARRQGQVRLAIQADPSSTSILKATNDALDDISRLSTELGALYVSDTDLQAAGNQLAESLGYFEKCVFWARLTAEPKVVIPVLEKHIASVLVACAAIELGVEAYIFGGSARQRDARDRLNEARAKLRDATSN